MKFSKDTSRLVHGKPYWVYRYGELQMLTFDEGWHLGMSILWGDEYVPPTVELEFEPKFEVGDWVDGGSGPLFVRDRRYIEQPGYWDYLVTLDEYKSPEQGRWSLLTGFDKVSKPEPPKPKPAWTPPVCPAGQTYLDEDGEIAISYYTRPLRAGWRYPKPSWPPRIQEHINFHYADEGEWSHVPCLSDEMKDARGRWYVLVPNGRAYRDDEGVTWRWVYRDLSDYTPPGGARD